MATPTARYDATPSAVRTISVCCARFPTGRESRVGLTPATLPNRRKHSVALGLPSWVHARRILLSARKARALACDDAGGRPQCAAIELCGADGGGRAVTIGPHRPQYHSDQSADVAVGGPADAVSQRRHAAPGGGAPHCCR